MRRRSSAPPEELLPTHSTLTPNLADGPSRGNRLGQEIRIRDVQVAMPALAAFEHPFLEPEYPPYG